MTHLTTHLQVLSVTHPELREALANIMQSEVTSDQLARYQDSPLFHNIIADLSAVTQGYSSNHNKMNLTLNQLSDLVDVISNIDYETLSDAQRDSLPELAQEIDQTSYHIREEIYPEVSAQKEAMVSQLASYQNMFSDYIQRLNKHLDKMLSDTNEKFGLSVEWTEGKQHLTWADLNHWLDRNSQLSDKIQNHIQSDKETTLGFLKAVVAMEFMAHIFQTAPSETSKDSEKSAQKILKYIYAMDFEDTEFPVAEVTEGQFVAEFDEIEESVAKLQSTLAEYPIKGSTLESKEVEDFERLTKTDRIFTKAIEED